MVSIIVSHSSSSSTFFSLSPHLRQSHYSPPIPCRISARFSSNRWLTPQFSVTRLDSFNSRCSITNTDVFSDVANEEEFREDFSEADSNCSVPIVHLKPDVLETESLNLLAEGAYVDNLLTVLPVLSEEEQNVIAATPAHPAGLYALYASCLAGNLVEQLWCFAWPAAIALLHPSLLPVAVMGLFTKLAVIVGGPLVGRLMDHFPRVPAYNFLSTVQGGRGKMGYLTGQKRAPATEDPSYATWDEENSIVMTWLVNSMTEEISSNYMCFSTAKDLWDNVNQMYSDLGNQSQVYELTLRLHQKQQGDESVTKYFNSLKRLWQDLDLFNEYEWKCTSDLNHFNKTVEASRIYQFLAGLNVEFDEVRGRIICRVPLPNISEVFAEVRREESRRHVMLGKQPAVKSVEGSALNSAEFLANKSATWQPGTGGKPRIWCDYCNKPCHTRESCWKIHGKPENWQSKKPGEKVNRPNPRANTAAGEIDASSFTNEQIGQIVNMLKSSLLSGIPTGSHAQTGPDLGEEDWQC